MSEYLFCRIFLYLLSYTDMHIYIYDHVNLLERNVVVPIIVEPKNELDISVPNQKE
jgi:hypothetical protein